jgi:hypothetical protein
MQCAAQITPAAHSEPCRQRGTGCFLKLVKVLSGCPDIKERMCGTSATNTAAQCHAVAITPNRHIQHFTTSCASKATRQIPTCATKSPKPKACSIASGSHQAGASAVPSVSSVAVYGFAAGVSECKLCPADPYLLLLRLSLRPQHMFHAIECGGAAECATIAMLPCHGWHLCLPAQAAYTVCCSTSVRPCNGRDHKAPSRYLVQTALTSRMSRLDCCTACLPL